MTAAQVCDWLKKHYQEDIKERTVRRYVKNLREKYHLKKSNHPRDYEAVDELPMGKQLQVDFGEKWMESIDGQRVKLRFVALVLAHSRYKWAFFQTRPFRKRSGSHVVKFIKYNFHENRLFADEEILNSSFLDWLDRTGNAKIHGTTKKVPAKVFEEEREQLRPLLYRL
ncbi:hypothetical protein [Desulfosporosinus sp. Sb-LF]|uniref:hypothetical protein n=1 Tax=Desulfosporosinus sp. Sb-LF TaxID=2560027 RepID=UPI001FB0C285|nr:hypothetical protein [Desulfosporosinus sp. Sb-LF]